MGSFERCIGLEEREGREGFKEENFILLTLALPLPLEHAGC